MEWYYYVLIITGVGLGLILLYIILRQQKTISVIPILSNTISQVSNKLQLRGTSRRRYYKHPYTTRRKRENKLSIIDKRAKKPIILRTRREKDIIFKPRESNRATRGGIIDIKKNNNKIGSFDLWLDENEEIFINGKSKGQHKVTLVEFIDIDSAERKKGYGKLTINHMESESENNEAEYIKIIHVSNREFFKYMGFKASGTDEKTSRTWVKKVKKVNK